MAGDLFQILSDAGRERLRARAQPRWVEPMLATLTDERFSDPDWIFERKLDGVRVRRIGLQDREEARRSDVGGVRRYAGKVGTGFDEETLVDLGARGGFVLDH